MRTWTWTLLLTVTLASLLPAALRAQTTVVSGTTRVAIDPTIARDLGIEVAGPPDASFRVTAGSALALASAPGDFEGFAAGSLRHQGGPLLRLATGTVDLRNFELAAATDPLELELRDAAGRAWLRVSSLQVTFQGDRLRLRNGDLLLGPGLSASLGRPELEGSFLGVVEADWGSSVPAAQGGGGAGGACDPSPTPPIDVALTEIESLTQAAREAGGRVAMAPSASLENVGSGAIPWNYPIAPDSPVGAHPFLLMQLYRLADGVLEQIGRADVKHAFFATNTGCGCVPGNVFFPGCADDYGVSTNLNRTYLAPRGEVTPRSGAWASLGSHFDGTPVNNVRNHFGNTDHDAFQHRLVVQEPELETAGARYFIEAWYLVAGDANLLNGVGHREVNPTLIGGTWSFPFVDAALAPGSILDAWVDPAGPAPGEESELLDTGEGRLQLAVRAVAVGGGLHRFEYALMNFDYDRQVRSFSVPLPPGQSATDAEFHDGDADPSNDWAVSIGGGAISWTAPAQAGLDWGELRSFGFSAPEPPFPTVVTLLPLEGDPTSVQIPSLGPPSSLPVRELPPGWRWALLGALLAGLLLLARRGARASAGG